MPVGTWGYTLPADRAAGEGRQRAGAGASAQVEFVEHVGAATELVDDEEHVAYVDVDAALELGVVLEVAGERLDVAVEGQTDEFALGVEHAEPELPPVMSLFERKQVGSFPSSRA